ncbi:MAG: T9SS type A sorting domain-containing protein [Saprospiraceae bacterium]
MPCASLRHLTFSKTSGREPLTYKWNTNETSPDIIVNKSGDYIITVADPYGCTIEKSKMIELSESFFENLEGPNKVCANDINPMYSFLGNSSLYDYTLTEKKLPNGPENTSTLNSNNDVYSFIVNISNKSGTYQLIVRSRNKNSQTVCDSLLLELEVNGIEKPEIVDSFYSCRPFQYILREDNGNQIDWYNLVNGELYKIQNGNIISVNSGGLYVGIYNDVNGCTAQDTINLLEQNDLRTFISGCYDVCDTIIAKGNVFVPGLDGNRIYKSWKYVHIDSNNIIKQGSDSKVDSFLLLKKHEGKIYLVVEDYHGCIDTSDLLCLSVPECVQAMNCDTIYLNCPHLSFNKDSFDCVNMMGYYSVNGEIIVSGDYNLCMPNPLEIKNFIWVQQPTITRMGNTIKIEGGKLKMHVDSCTGSIDIYVRLCKNGAECKKLLDDYELECFHNTCGVIAVVSVPQNTTTTRIQIYGYIDNKENCGTTYNYVKVTLLTDNCQQQLAQKFVQKLNFNEYYTYFDILNDSLQNCYCVRVNLCSNQNNCLASCDIQGVCTGSSQLRSAGGSNGLNVDFTCVNQTQSGINNYTFNSSYDQNQLGIYMDEVQLLNNDNINHYCNDGDCSGGFHASSSLTTIETRFMMKFLDYPYATFGIDTSYSLPGCSSTPLKKKPNSGPESSEGLINNLGGQMLNEDIWIIPNPAKDVIKVYFTIPSDESGYGIKMLDFKGNVIKVVSCQSNSSYIDINLIEYSSGLYYINLTKDGGFRKAQKVVVIK